MSKPLIIITADIHCRKTKPQCRTDNYQEAQSKKLEFLFKKQKELDVPIIDAGDFLNHHKCSPFLETSLIENVPKDVLYTIPGNHDLPYNTMDCLKDSSLRVLEAAGAINILLEPIIMEVNGFSLYIHPFPFSFEENFSYNIPEDDADIKIAVAHTFVSKKGELPNSYSARKIMGELPDFDVIITGHNHQSFMQENKTQTLINPGSMMRMYADQGDYLPCFYVLYDDGNIKTIPYPIVDNVIDRSYIDKKKTTDARLEAFVSNINNDYEVELSFEKNMDSYLCSNETSKEVITQIKLAMGVEDE
jgi:predicted phosphodiesterase